MIKPLLLIAVALACGCATATRTSIAPEERSYRYTVKHSIPQARAFSAVELALAESYNSLPNVMKLRQPETGTMLLRPKLSYMVGGPLGAKWYHQYTLKIVVYTGSISVSYELEPDDVHGLWPPVPQMPGVQAEFRQVTEKIAQAVGGAVSPAR